MYALTSKDRFTFSLINCYQNHQKGDVTRSLNKNMPSSELIALLISCLVLLILLFVFVLLFVVYTVWILCAFLRFSVISI